MERQFVRGFMDGALSILGVVIGASAGQLEVIISAGIGGSIANGISNTFSALTAERVEEEKELSELEKSLLTELKDTELHREIRRKVVRGGLADGVSTIIGGVIPVLPFILSYSIHITHQMAMMSSVAITALALAFVGIYYGRISREHFLISAIKMVLIALLVALVSTGVEKGIHELVT